MPSREPSGQPGLRPGAMEVVISIEDTTPGTAQDSALRREQARALLDLLAASRDPEGGGRAHKRRGH